MEQPFLASGSRVCIVGAGSIGVYAAKWCKHFGLVPTVFEQASSVGGVWRQDPPPQAETLADFCHGSAYDSLCTNSSHALMAASDFPFPFTPTRDFPMHHEIVRYINEYADQFGVRPHIRFGTRVVAVAPLHDHQHQHQHDHEQDHEQTGGAVGRGRSCERWVVTVQPLAGAGGSPEERLEFDAVMVCSGQFWSPAMPALAGEADFVAAGGSVSHSHTYRSPVQLGLVPPNAGTGGGRNKRVVVVGVGNSGLDISLETARAVGTKESPVLVSSRSGTAVLPVSDSYGRPCDQLLSSRFFNEGLPKIAQGLWMAAHIRGTNATFNAAGLPPQDPASVQSHFSNVKEHADYCAMLAAGRLAFRPGIARLVAHHSHSPGDGDTGGGEDGDEDGGGPGPGVVFTDGTSARCDAIICCTGYEMAFPFLNPRLLYGNDENSSGGSTGGVLRTDTRAYYGGTTKTTTWLNAYKHVMHPQHRSLAFLGIVNTLGNEAAVGEMQARWILSHWTSAPPGPTAPGPVAGLESGSPPRLVPACSRGMPAAAAVSRYLDRKSKFRADHKPDFAGFEPYLQYMDDLARDVGCRPDTTFPVTVDPTRLRLWWALWMAPNVPAVYRLRGPDPWPGAEAHLVSAVAPLPLPSGLFAFPPGVAVPVDVAASAAVNLAASATADAATAGRSKL